MVCYLKITSPPGLLVERGAGCGMVTLGAQGVIFKQGQGDCVHVPCPKVKAIDTTVR